MYSLAPQYITPRGPETQTNTATDGSMSVYGYVTISYNRQAYTQTIDKFLLTEVEGGWEIEDNSKTRGRFFCLDKASLQHYNQCWRDATCREMPGSKAKVAFST